MKIRPSQLKDLPEGLPVFRQEILHNRKSSLDNLERLSPDDARKGLAFLSNGKVAFVKSSQGRWKIVKEQEIDGNHLGSMILNFLAQYRQPASLSQQTSAA